MKINEIYIRAFGGISDYKLDFNPQMQIIYGDNETGKRTIQNFIKTIFYGFGKSGHSVETNNRKKYMPWSGQEMGGYIIFSHQGLIYRLDRSFAKRKADDQTELLLEKDGKQIHLENSDQPGYELFQISEVEFLNKAFLAKAKVDNENLTTLDQKTNNKIGLAEYDWSFEEINSRLNKARQYYQADRGELGYLTDLQKHFDDLSVQLQEKLAGDQEIARLGLAIAATEEKLKGLTERENNLKLQKVQHQKLKLAERFEKYKKLQAELELKTDIKGQTESDILKSKSVTVQDLTDIAMQRQQTANALSEYEIKYNYAQERFAEQSKYMEEAEGKKANILRERSRLQYLRQKNLERGARPYKKPKISITSFIPLVIAEIFSLILGLILRNKSPIFSAILIVLAVLLPFIMVVFYFVLQKRQERQIKAYETALRNHQMRKLKIENELQDLEWSLDRIENHIQAFGTERDQLQDDLEQANIIYERELNKLKYLIKPYFTKLPNDDQLDLAIQSLREQTVDSVHNEEKINAIKAEMRELKGHYKPAEFYQQYLEAQDWLRDHQADLRTFPEFSQNHIESQLQGIEEERLKLREKLAADKSNLEHLNKNQISTIELENKLAKTEEEIKAAEFNYKSILMSIHLLERSRMSFEQEIRPLLNKKAAAYLSLMTGAEYNDLAIDKNFNLKLKSEDTAFHDQANNTGGLNYQINLALRLALTELLQDSIAKLPLILDDPFIQLDQARAKRTFALVKDLNKKGKRQIILFTSQKSIYNIVDSERDVIRCL